MSGVKYAKNVQGVGVVKSEGKTLFTVAKTQKRSPGIKNAANAK